jgi:hypothetical protein
MSPAESKERSESKVLSNPPLRKTPWPSRAPTSTGAVEPFPNTTAKPRLSALTIASPRPSLLASPATFANPQQRAAGDLISAAAEVGDVDGSGRRPAEDHRRTLLESTAP